MSANPHFEPAPSASATGADFDIHHYLAVLRRYWVLIVVLAGVGGGLGYMGQSNATAIYEAKTVIQIERRSLSSQLTDDSSWADSWWDAEYYPTMYRLLESRGLAEQVVDALRLDEDPDFVGRAVAGAGGAAGDEAARARIAQRLLSGLRVEPVLRTQLVELFYRSPDPEFAAEVSNGIASVFIDWTTASRRSATDSATEILSGEITALKEAIRAKDAEVREFSSTLDAAALDSGPGATNTRVVALNQTLNEATSRRLEKEARFRQVERLPSDELVHGEVGPLPAEEALTVLESEYQSRLAVYKPDHPDMVALASKVDEARGRVATALEDEADRLRSRAYSEYQTARRAEEEIRGEIRGIRDSTTRSSSALLDLASLQQELANRQRQLEGVLERQSQTEVESRLQETGRPNVRIVDKAVVPSAPMGPRVRSNVAFGSGAGLALGIALSLMLNFLDRTVKETEEVERLTGLPTLGTIPDVGSGRAPGTYGKGAVRRFRRKSRRSASGDGKEREKTIELVPDEQPNLAVSEAYRSLRASLLLSSAETLKTIVISSATSGDGKSTTATNLGVVLAQLGRRVLLVDGDLRRSRQHQLFGVSNRVGLVHCLTGSARPASCVAATSVDNLSLLPAGPMPPNPSELLGSERMGEILAWCRDAYDVVVIDSPPVLAVSDAILLASRSDGLVFCVRARKSLRDEVKRSRERLEVAGIRVLGTVLNRYRPASRHGYYEGGYHYYQSYQRLDEGDSAA